MESESKKSFYETLRNLVGVKKNMDYTVKNIFEVAELLRDEYENLMGRNASTEEYLLFIDIAANLISKR
jgi:hypothetical protein